MGTIKIIVLSIVALYVLIAAVFYFLQESMIFLDEPLPNDFVYQFEAEFQERNFVMADGAVLNALHFKVDSAKGVILYFHGNAGNLARWGDIADDLVRYGYDVLIFDYRGYGKSTGKRSQSKLYNDGLAIYRELLNEYQANQIVLYGRSLGTGMAVWLAAQTSPRHLILETPYYSLTQVALHHYPIFPISYLNRFRFPSFQFIGQVTCPVTVFHGTSDEVVPYSSGQKLFALVKSSNANFITIPEGGHNNLSQYDAYWSQLAETLK